MASEVVRNESAQRYELLVDDELVGIADYRVTDGILVFPHTEIASAMRGRGLGAVLVRGALDDVRRRGQRIVPQCWYVAEFIADNADYADLLAATSV
jgi:predicted GNAT family acetyltransferase